MTRRYQKSDRRSNDWRQLIQESGQENQISELSQTPNVEQTSAREDVPNDLLTRRDDRASKRKISTIRQVSAEQEESAVNPAVQKRIDDAIATASKFNPSARTRRSSSEDKSVAKPAAAENADELMVAFKDYPPEVQREALRRLVAATAKSAERTDQPKSVTRQLQNQLRRPAIVTRFFRARSKRDASETHRIKGREFFCCLCGSQIRIRAIKETQSVAGRCYRFTGSGDRTGIERRRAKASGKIGCGNDQQSSFEQRGGEAGGCQTRS